MSQQLGLKMVYDEAREAIYNAAVRSGMSPEEARQAVDDAVLSQGSMRFEQVASTTTATYKFSILQNDGTVRPNEVRLQLQDAFYICQIQILIGLSLTADGGAAATAFRLYTYPSPTVFATAGAALALQNLYAGIMTISVNNSTIVPSWDILRHQVINQTQATGISNTAPFDQVNYGYDGGYPTQPNIVLIGSKNNVITLQLPAAIGTLQAAATTVLVIIVRGIRAQNVTVVS